MVEMCTERKMRIEQIRKMRMNKNKNVAEWGEEKYNELFDFLVNNLKSLESEMVERGML